MPTISMFYGIIVMMYFEIREKHHLAHIHVRYQNFRAAIAVERRQSFGGGASGKAITDGAGLG